MEQQLEDLLEIIKKTPHIKKLQLPLELQSGILITQLRDNGYWVMANKGYYITENKTEWIEFCNEFHKRGIQKIVKSRKWLPLNENQLNILGDK